MSAAGAASRGRCQSSPRRVPRRRWRRRPDAAVELRGITKRFPGVVANRDINIVVRRGQVHAIVGENGAGKSTLMKILYGMQRPDEGTIAVDGQEVGVPLAGRRDRRAASAWSTSTSCWPTTSPSWRTSSSAASRPRPACSTSARPGGGSRRSPTPTAWTSSPDPLVEDLGVGDRQRVEILKVLYRGAQHPDPRRAHRGARAAGGRRALRQPARAEERGPHGHLHLAQARRGARGRRRDHRHPPRHHGRDRRARRASPPASSPS